MKEVFCRDIGEIFAAEAGVFEVCDGEKLTDFSDDLNLEGRFRHGAMEALCTAERCQSFNC